MGKPYVPKDEAAKARAWQRDVERRMEASESAQRLTSSSVRGGSVSAYNQEYIHAVRMGEGQYSLTSGVRSIPVLSVTQLNGAFHLLIDQEDGWVSPSLSFGMTQDTFIPVTSATFVNTWKGLFVVMAKALVMDVLVTADTGCEGEVRLIFGERTSGSFLIESEEQLFMRFRWDLTDIAQFQSSAVVRVQALRSSGAGNINVYSPERLSAHSLRVITNATPSGIPSDF